MDHISVRSGNGDYPRPSGRELSVSQLRPADILLSRGDSTISDQIVAVDRGSYSHSALWSGSGIIESTLKGGIEEHAPTGERDVYRYRGLSDGQAKQVVETARQQVGGPYAVAEIHLLAVVFQKWWPFGQPRKSALGAILEMFGGKEAAKLRAWLQASYGNQAPRVCTELVALAYFEVCPLLVLPLDERPERPQSAAEAQHARPAAAAAALAVDPKAAMPNAPTLGSDEIEELHEQVRDALQGASAAAAGSALEGLFWGDVALNARTRHPIGVVTPGDLQFSPSLEFCGTLRAG